MKVTRSMKCAAIIAAAVTVLGIGMPSAVQAAVPGDGLVAEYVFDQTAGTEVTNSASGSSFGPAIVRNLQASDWTGSSLVLRGGAKTGAGDWVELPDDILAGQESATVTAEVKASAAMINGFHFLWNIGNDSSATEYFFASLNCGNGRTPLVGLKSGGVERLVQAGSCGVTADRWTNVTTVIDGAADTASLYIDGLRVAHGAMPASPANIVDQSLNAIGRSPWPDPLFQGEISSFRVYDRALSASDVAAVAGTDAEAHADQFRAQAQAIIDGLNLADFETSTDIDLPTASGKVSWISGDTSVIDADGAVNAPLAGEEPAQVTLTATAAVRGYTATRAITVTVLPSEETAAERAERVAGRFVIPPVVRSGDAVPAAPEGATVRVTGSGAGVTVGDTIETDAVDAVDTTIDVEVADMASGAKATRSFAVRVLPAGASQELLAYNRVPTTVATANNADVALSMHLAVGEDGRWTPLNENYGIFFPKTSVTPPTGGTSDGIIRSLRDPHLFYLEDGDFGIVSTRTARGGGADGTQSSKLLLARSGDLRSYQEIGLVDLGVSSGVNDPAVVFDSAAHRYLVSWMSDAGAPMYTTFDDLTDEGTRGEVLRGTITANAGAEGQSVQDYDSGNIVPVAGDVVDALEVRFGRIANTGVDALDGVEVAQGTTLTASDLPQRAALGYDDGSDAVRAIDWDAASVSGVDTSKPGAYEVTGTIKQTEYAAPFADERADPSVFRYDWNGRTKFLMIATDDTRGNNIGSPHMPIRIADSIGDLSDEAVGAGRNTEIALLSRGDLDAAGNAITGCFWAPEFHEIGGRLSVLFMPCYNGANGTPDMWTGRASIIQLKQDGMGRDLDPAMPSNWTKAQQVLRTDGSALNQVQGISLDMTFFQDSGRSYYAWQMLGSLFVASVDPADPTRLTSAPVRIYAPQYAWDNTIAEGPNVQLHDGTLFMIYSGSTVGDSYTTGLLTAKADSGIDLTQAAAWSPLNYPIQKSGLFNGEWQLGTGHGMWSYDEDDNLIYVFHARTDHNGLPGRDMFVRRVHWASDGLPVFDMEQDEEVAPGNRTVTVTVTVTAGAAVQVAATTRCVAGKVTLVMTVRNTSSSEASASVTTPYGSKEGVKVAAGGSVSQAFSTRAVEIGAGEASATASGSTATAEYAAASCR